MNKIIFAVAAFSLVIFSLQAVSTVWAYGDARARGQSSLPIALFVLIFWPASLLVWLLLRPSHPDPAKNSSKRKRVLYAFVLFLLSPLVVVGGFWVAAQLLQVRDNHKRLQSINEEISRLQSFRKSIERHPELTDGLVLAEKTMAELEVEKKALEGGNPKK